MGFWSMECVLAPNTADKHVSKADEGSHDIDVTEWKSSYVGRYLLSDLEAHRDLPSEVKGELWYCTGLQDSMSYVGKVCRQLAPVMPF